MSPVLTPIKGPRQCESWPTCQQAAGPPQRGTFSGTAISERWPSQSQRVGWRPSACGQHYQSPRV